jgi:capsular polysaccharide biosynthesis protein
MLSDGTVLDLVPDRLPEEDVVRVHDEEVVWGGPIAAPDRFGRMSTFGHFMVGSVARLWPLLPGAELEGLPVVFTRPRELSYVDEWLAAFGARTVELPERGAVCFKRMFVPEPAWRLAGWIAPEIRDIHLHARQGLAGPPAPRSDVLWLSRSELEPDRIPHDEGVLESLLGDRVAVVNPETMTLAEQVATLEGSRAVAGVIGSAFHTLLMTAETPDCLYLCPPWDKREVSDQHRLLEADATFAPALEIEALTHRARERGIRFPNGYRLLIPESLRALEATVLPTLLRDPKIAAFAEPPAKSPKTLGWSGKEASLPRGSLGLSEARDLLVVRSHAGAFEPDGACAVDTVRARGEQALKDFVPGRLTDTDVIRTDEEEVVWGGVIMPHYGHFLVESVARLWPLLPGAELEGLPVVFTRPRELSYVDEWLAAFGARTVELPQQGTVRFTRMFVPEPAWRLGGWIAPEARDIHLHARQGLAGPPAPRSDVLWLSRSELPQKRLAYDEGLLEWLLADHVKFVNPETMTLAEQVATLEGSRAVAGVIGSAFHTLLMTAETPDCLYLCPPWDKGAFPVQHRLLDADATFAPALEIGALTRRTREWGVSFPRGYRLMIPETLRALRDTVLPTLLDDPRIAAFADAAGQQSGRANRGSADDLDSAVARVLLEPLSIEARMKLGSLFEAEGFSRCAREQFAMVADLSDDHAQPAAP